MICQSQLTDGNLHVFVSEHDEQVTKISVTWQEAAESTRQDFLGESIECTEANEHQVVILGWQGEQAAQVLVVMVYHGETNANFDTDTYPNESRQDLALQGHSTVKGDLNCQSGDQECTLQFPTGAAPQ